MLGARAQVGRVFGPEDHQLGIATVAVRTLNDVMARGLAERRLALLVLQAFGAVALLLSMVGLYGVLAYVVSQRTHEIGVRVALGASPRAVVWLMLARSLRLAGAGVAIGFAAAATFAPAQRAAGVDPCIALRSE